MWFNRRQFDQSKWEKKQNFLQSSFCIPMNEGKLKPVYTSGFGARGFETPRQAKIPPKNYI